MKKVKNLGLTQIDTLNMRAQYAPKETSESRSRDMVYTAVRANQLKCFYLCNKICVQHRPCCAKSDDATALVKQLIADSGASDVPFVVALPSPDTQVLVSCEEISRFWKYLIKCREVRGEEKGIGTLTMGYSFGETTRMITKYMTHFWDIMQVMLLYKCSVLVVTGDLKEYLVRMLVANNIYVVNYKNTGSPVLTRVELTKSVYGLYGSIQDGIEYIVYEMLSSEPPRMAKGHLEYSNIDMEKIIANPFTTRKHRKAMFTRMHLNPAMSDNNSNYGFLPAALAHNGMVIITSPKVKDFKMKDLIIRASQANSCRNNFLCVRRPFCYLDIFNSDVPYFKTFNLPKLMVESSKKKEAIDFTTDLKMPKLPNEKVIPVLPLTIAVNFRQLATPTDISELITSVITTALLNENGFFDILYNWEGNATSAVLALRDRMSRMEFVTHVRDRKIARIDIDDILQQVIRLETRDRENNTQREVRPPPAQPVVVETAVDQIEDFTQYLRTDNTGAGVIPDRKDYDVGDDGEKINKKKPPKQPNSNSSSSSSRGRSPGSRDPRGRGGTRGRRGGRFTPTGSQ